MSSTLSPAFAIDEVALLGELGISTPRQIVCRPPAIERGCLAAVRELPGERVVIKVIEPFIAHKTEQGAVRVVPRDAKEIERAIRDLMLRLDAQKIAIVEFIEHDVAPGGELLLAIRWTAEFGPIVTFGAGGVAAEVMSSVAVFAPGIATDVQRAFQGKAFAPLVTGFRNQAAKIPSRELQALLRRCLAFASARLPHSLNEIEINPLVPTPRGLFALDVLITPARHDQQPHPAARPIEKIERLLHPRSVAVMGVSSTGMNAGRVIVRNALAGNPDTAPSLQIVKPGESQIDGVPCVADLASLNPVDLLVLSIPAEQVPQVIESVVDGAKAESIIVIPGGLGEHAGSETLEQKVRDSIAASRATQWQGPVINGANCLGVASPTINTIFLPKEKFTTPEPRELPLALVSQSGALAVTLMTKLAPYAPRHVVSVGNQLDLTVGDYLRYFANRSDADVLAFYVEGFGALDGRQWFDAAASLVREGRDLILYRAGRTAAGQKASSSHTASIAGDAVIARELARQTGVRFAETLDEFTDLILLSSLFRGRARSGRKLGAVSNAGFEAVAIADNLGTLELATFAPATNETLTAIVKESRLDRIVTIANPLDVNPMLDDALFTRVAEAVLRDPEVDAAVIGCVPLSGAVKTLPHEIDDDRSVVNRLTALWRETSKPWVVVLDSGPLYDAAASRFHAAGVPVFRSADRAVRALAKWVG